MLLLVATLALISVEAMLATFVAAKAWKHPPARMFVVLVATMVVLNVSWFIQSQADNAATAYVSGSLFMLSLSVFTIINLVIISMLFMPQWWQAPYAIRWILLPYILVLIAITIDLIGRIGLFVDGVALEMGFYRLNLIGLGEIILRMLFTVGWLVHMVMLGVAMVHQRQHRFLIGLLLLSITLSYVTPILLSRSEQLRPYIGLFQSGFVLVALAYAVLRTQLLVSTRAALDMAIRAMSEAVAVVDHQGTIIYVNPMATTLGLHAPQSLATALSLQRIDAAQIARLISKVSHTATPAVQTLILGQRRVQFSLTPVKDEQGYVQGTLLLGRDITDLEQRNALLEREQAQLAATIQQLEVERSERAMLNATVQSLALPVIPVLQGVLVLPLIGDFTEARVEEFISTLLRGIEQQRAHLVLIDITGIPLLDTAGAHGILRGVEAAALLGARCVLVGVRPEISQALVALDVPLTELQTAATLQQALQREFQRGAAIK